MSTTLKMSSGDIFIHSATGKARVINGAEKCSQDLAETLLTPLFPEKQSRSSLAFPRDYGSELAYVNAPPEYSGIVGKPLVAKKIEEAVTRLQIMQRDDPIITDEERITGINRLFVDQLNTSDFIFFLEVQVASGTALELSKLSPVELDHLSVVTSRRDDRKPPRIS